MPVWLWFGPAAWHEPPFTKQVGHCFHFQSPRGCKPFAKLITVCSIRPSEAGCRVFHVVVASELNGGAVRTQAWRRAKRPGAAGRTPRPCSGPVMGVAAPLARSSSFSASWDGLARRIRSVGGQCLHRLRGASGPTSDADPELAVLRVRVRSGSGSWCTGEPPGQRRPWSTARRAGLHVAE